MAVWPRLTTWVAVTLVKAIEAQTAADLAIKWPNDLLAHGRKVAGILTEMHADGRGNPFAVVGIGINVNHAADDFPAELQATATSLRLAGGRFIDRSELAAALLRQLERARRA